MHKMLLYLNKASRDLNKNTEQDMHKYISANGSGALQICTSQLYVIDQ